MDFVLIFIAALIGFAAGGIIVAVVNRKRVSRGTLVVDLTDPEKDVFRLILDEDFGSLSQRKQVMLKVSVNDKSQG